MKAKIFLLFFAIQIFNSSIGQDLNYTLPSSGCLEEVIDIRNNSTGYDSYEWDLCLGDLENFPSGELHISNSQLNLPLKYRFAKSGFWHGFVPSFSTNSLSRYSYQAGLTGLPVESSLPELSGFLSNPMGLDFVQDESGNWFGYIVNRGSGDLTRIGFGSSLGNMPLSIENFSGLGLVAPEGLKIIYDNFSFKALITSVGNLILVDLGDGSNLSTTPSVIGSIAIPGAVRLYDVSVINDKGQFYALLTDNNRSELYHIDFGSSIGLTPNVSSINSGSYVIASPGDIALVADDNIFYGIFTQRSAPVVRMNFGTNVANLSPSFNEIYDKEDPNVFGFDMAYDSSKWVGMIASGGQNNIERIVFEKDCGLANDFISSFEPTNVKFSLSGSFGTQLLGYGVNGDVDTLHQTILISMDVSPSITFSVDPSRCIANSNTFTPNLTGLAGYSWDFDGDNSPDSEDEQPTYQFAAPGTYTVRLDVNDGSCNNFVEQEISIYSEPLVPSFEITAESSFCTGTELVFTNTTDETGYDDVLTYQWVIDGDIVDQSDTIYRFLSSGTKMISLQSFLPGCSSSISAQQIVIGEGPVVDFSYINNCFGDVVEFSSEVTGSGISGYSWDFGDGTGTSVLENPTYTYLTSGDYSVNLTVTNVNGCATQYSELLQVNGQSLVDFLIVENPIENLPATLLGEDLTLSKDSIEFWSWDVEGDVFSEKNVTYIFPSPGIYDVRLTITTHQGCFYELLKEVTVEDAPFPTIQISADIDLCIDEPGSFVNESVNAISYQWDLCPDDLIAVPRANVLENSLELSQPISVELIEEAGFWYAFVVNYSSNTLLRYDFGSSLEGTFSVTNLGDFNYQLDDPTGISLIKSNGIWYGLITSLGNNQIYLIAFDDGLESLPQISAVGTSDITSPDGVKWVAVNESLIALVVAGTDLQILNFGIDPLSTPIKETISIDGASRLWGIDVIKEGENWFGLVGGFSSNTLHHISFGSTINGSGVVTAIDGGGISFSSISDVVLLESGSRYYGMLNLRSGTILRVDFGGSISNVLPAIDEVSNISIGDNLGGLDIVYDSGRWTGLVTDYGNNSVNKLVFEDTCSVNNRFAEIFEPSNVRFTEQGVYGVSLIGEDENGNLSQGIASITVSSSIAPSISFTTDPSRCITNPNTFTPSLTGLTSYSWDFDGDNVEDSNQESPTFQYPSSGTYTVRLDVTDGTCGNFVEQEITIYPEPAIPTFTAETLVCINSEIAFTNTTDETGFDDVLSYEWDFNGEGSSTERNPSFAFETSGTKAVTLTSSIPGCEATSEVFQIEVSAGPAAAFNPSSFGICEGEFITFTDASTNGATNWDWDFGDGFTSTAQNPDHLFTVAGNYDVSLSVTDALGCESTTTEEVSIAALPAVSFDFDVVCTSAGGIQFMDLSTVEGADIVSRAWYVDAAETANEENPILSFENEGSVNIRLEVTSSNGCTSSYNEDVQILPSPQPDFSISIGCEGEASAFIDLTNSAGNPVGTWLWSLDGATYNTQNISHAFSGIGIFEVTLEVTGQNFCSETRMKTVEILELPEVDFSIDGDCSNEFITLSDATVAFQDPVISRNWMLDGAVVGNGNELLLEALPQSTYDLVLEVTTESGCVVSSSQELLINSTPSSSFELARNFGVPGDEIVFSNESSGAVDYQWFFNGVANGIESGEKVITFPEEGRQEISLVSTNSVGCSDTTTTEVLIAVPQVDLSIGQFEVVNSENSGRIFVEIQNNSNLPIEVTEAVIELENQFSVTEEIASLIEVGESRLVSLNTGIPLNTSELSYLCVTLNSQYRDYPDLTPVNNEKCISIQPNAIVVEAPYPNPARTETRVKLIAPTEGNAVISLFNSSGKVEFTYTENVEEGLNSFFLNIKDLQAGIYFVRLQFNETISVQRIIKL